MVLATQESLTINVSLVKNTCVPQKDAKNDLKKNFPRGCVLTTLVSSVAKFMTMANVHVARTNAWFRVVKILSLEENRCLMIL
jgi:hypothetical protein